MGSPIKIYLGIRSKWKLGEKPLNIKTIKLNRLLENSKNKSSNRNFIYYLESFKIRKLFLESLDTSLLRCKFGQLNRNTNPFKLIVTKL